MRWATRARPHIDRCATAWLVKRFVDPRAVFLFIGPGESAPAGATPFDMPGAKYGHHGEDCTFETAVRLHRLERDGALRAVAELVHHTDFHLGGRKDAELLAALVEGTLLEEPDDGRVLARTAAMFDALYARERARSEAHA